MTAHPIRDVLFGVGFAIAFGLVLYTCDVMETERVSNAEMVTKPRPATLPRTNAPELPPESDRLNGAAGCEDGKVIVENRSSDVWEDARIELNDVWKYSPGVIVPGRQPYLPYLFTKSDGTRLDLAFVSCRSINMHATVRGKRMHWNGAY